MTPIPCARFDEECGELVLGLLPGEARAAALAHVAGCARCRERLEQLSRVVDELLMTGPSVEPPAGFEQRTLARLAEESDRGHRRDRPPSAASRRNRVLAVAAAIVVVLGVAAGVWAATRGHGARSGAVEAAAMVDPSGRTVGRIDLGRDPATVFVALPDWVQYKTPAGAPVAYRLRFDLAGGGQADVGPVSFAPGRDTWGAAVAFHTDTARSVTMLDASGRVLCHAQLNG